MTVAIQAHGVDRGTMRYLLVVVVLASACAAKRPQVEMVPNAVAQGTFLQMAAADAAAASDASIAQTIGSVCDGVCDRVFVTVTDTTPPDVLLRIAAVAATIEPLPRVFVLAPNANRMELDLSAADCVVEVGVEPNGAYVIREGERLAPDPTCERWDATICRGSDDLYDWPRLRSEVGVLEEVCVAFATPTVAELPLIHETLRQPRLHLVKPRDASAAIGADQLTAVIKKLGPDLQWCLEGEVVDEPVPVKATLRLAVHVDGSVTRAEVVHATRSTPQFEDCIVDVAQRKFHFESPGPAPVVVDIPLSFEPGARGPTMLSE